MDSRNYSMGGDGIDWADPAFSSSEFQDAMTVAESPWSNSAFNDFTNLADYSDSPANLGIRTPSKSGPDGASAGQQQNYGYQGAPSAAGESSSQDSSSDTSSRRKRKVESESPMADAADPRAKKEDSAMGMGRYGTARTYEQTFNQPLPNMAVDQGMSDQNDGMFDFNSAASSPNLPRDFNQQLSLDAKMKLPASTTAPQFTQESPVQTINPHMFQLEGSRDQSPATTNMMFGTASPNAIFSTPSSDSNETFTANQNWNVGQNPSWSADFGSQFASPGGLAFTPSPVANGGTPAMASRGTVVRAGRSPLHIAPISTKSRVETQINVVMTLEKPPSNVETLHLPLHTIAKSKLLAKEDVDKSKTLELHTMLVCSSAMHNPANKEKALQRAASQDNDEIQNRAEQMRDSGDEEKNDMKNVDEVDKPANGGEVRICTNCIQRERKRAGRKKLKKEEEQQHWERYETERVVVFNSNEYLPFKPFEQSQQPQKDNGLGLEEPYNPPEGAISVAAAMRIACYCRHQSEKEGFQVILTMKDQQGNVVAQEISDSILITDDHKTHPPQLTTMSGDMLYHAASQFQPNGLPTSYSMMDLSSHAQPFTSSRSAGNLQALAYGQPQFNPHSHVHQLPNNGFASQTTSATMTPTSLSRPGSPTSAGQAGPNKKRKQSTQHKRLPSGLQMTPRVDTGSQPASANPAGMPMSSNLSPTGGAFGQNDQSYMTIPNSGPAQYYGSGPPTPANENTHFALSQPHQLDIARAQNASAYFSHPSSAVPSRSNSPVMQSARPNMAAFARQPIQTPTNQMRGAPQMFGGQAAQGASTNDGDQATAPSITKITPTEGPVIGGTEVSIFGYHFTHGTQIMFGDQVAPTTFYGPQSILAISPPGRRGPHRVKLVPTPGSPQYNSPQSSHQVFTYTDTNPKMMEMALRFLSQQQTGDPGRWAQYTHDVANQFMQTSISPAGIQGQGYGGGNMMATQAPDLEDMVLKVFDLVDVSEVPRQPCYDLRSDSGQTMLSMASALGMHRVVAALLARGANPDTRDVCGYTPLMQAALQGRSKTFQLLLVKGADATIRSLKGYAAIELVSSEDRDVFLQILQNTQRTRSARPSLHLRHSFGSNTSSRSSWDISSASFYESEADTSETAVSVPPSRRPSANLPLLVMPEEAGPPPTSAAMVLWRDALAAQIYQFQQNVHTSMSSFHLPTLPPLPDYQDNAMVRRLSSLVPSRSITVRPPGEETLSPSQQPSFWDMFSSPSPASSGPPPAYSELFPDRTQGSVDQSTKKAAVQSAVIDAVADEKCVMMFDHSLEVGSSSTSASEQAERPKKADHAAISMWLWVPLLVILTSIIMHAMMPYISTIPTQAFSVFRSPSRVLVVG